MRRRDREIKDAKGFMDIINNCPVCRIAIHDNPAPYIVPLNFGYIYHEDDNQLVLYFHCAKDGKKIDLLKTNPNVGFEMDCNHKLVESEKACDYSFIYASIIGSGEVELIENSLEKTEALNCIMKHQSGKIFNFTDNNLQSVDVFKIMVHWFTGKSSDKCCS